MSKIRNGFVSNSSSSSFIVAFDKDPQSPKELKLMMFQPEIDKGIIALNNYTLDRIAETVYMDIEEQRQKKQLILNPVAIACMECGAYVPSVMKKFYSHIEESTDEYWEVEEALESMRDDNFAEFREEHKNKVIYKFSYADENGSYEGTLEHGGIFDNIAHEVESHH